MPNKSCNGPQGNQTAVHPDKNFVPVFETFPLTDFPKDKSGKVILKITDEEVDALRHFDIENKK